MQENLLIIAVVLQSTAFCQGQYRLL